MRWRSLIPAIFCLALHPLWSADPAHEASKKGAEEKKQSETGGFDVPVPLGIPVKGIKIPHRNEEGKLVMTIEAEVATKLDEQHVDMQNMKIESFDDDGKKINIELPHSIFNLETRILTGDTGALIRREDFEITGDSVEFNTKTRYATLRGKIRMVIQSADIDK
ncbi:MAG: LPS export ABC transporter periplasmic protein LptC [Verrucomicrobiota bacterium]